MKRPRRLVGLLAALLGGLLALAGPSYATNVVPHFGASWVSVFEQFSGGGDIIRADPADGTNRDQGFQVDTVTGTADRHDWSSDGSRVVYARAGDIVVRDVATGTEHVVGQGYAPTISPDGKNVAFAVRDSATGGSTLVRADVDGTHHRTTLIPLKNPADPPINDLDWSPKGDKLAFDRQTSATSPADCGGASGGCLMVRIFTIDAAGGTPAVVSTQTAANERDASWSPDAKSLVLVREQLTYFTTSQTVAAQIVVMPATGGAGTVLATTPTYGGSRSFDLHAPEFSPDGSMIAYAKIPHGTSAGSFNYDVYMMPSGGGASTLWRHGDFPEWVPAPNGFNLTGRVTDSKGRARAGVTIEARGASSVSTSTDSGGRYRFQLPAGSYTVTPQIVMQGESFEPASRTVNLQSDTTGVDFVRLGHTLQVALSAAPVVQADGFANATAKISDTDSRGQPVAGEKLDLSPPLVLPPAVLVCGPNGRFYPGRFPDGSYDTARSQAQTDSNGQVNLDLFAGTQSGNWQLDVSETADAQTKAADVFALEASSASFPGDRIWTDLQKLIKKNDNNVTQFSHKNGSKEERTSLNLALTGNQGADQELLLEWLTQAKDEVSALNPLPNVDFAPIHSSANRAAVVFYPRGADFNSVDASSARVLDVTVAKEFVEGILGQLPGGGHVTPQLLPTLAQWQQQHGHAERGHLVPTGADPFTYFGFPYPPKAFELRTKFDDECVKPDPASFTVKVGSPLRLLFHAHGHTFGLSPAGKLVAHGAAGVVAVNGRHEGTQYTLATGAYTVDLSGTAAGKATVAFLSAGAKGAQVRVFSFKTRKGASGSLSVSRSGPASSLHFDGHVVHAGGYALAVSGVPSKLKPGKTVSLKLTVRDPFGAAIPGALVRITGPHGFLATGYTDTHGRVKLTIKPPAGKLVVKVTSPGSAPAAQTVKVK